MRYVCIGDGLTIQRSEECAALRATDRFEPFSCFLFVIGMFHFYWSLPLPCVVHVYVECIWLWHMYARMFRYCLKIVFAAMWPFGLGALAGLQGTRVKEDCKKFNDCDDFFHLVFLGHKR